MRSIFLILLLANLVFVALQFPAVRDFVSSRPSATPAPALNAEKLRIIRDTSGRSAPPAATNPN